MTQFELKHGDNLQTLKTYADNTFDSIVTDPPYGIDFLGKEWDTHTGTVELYKECLRVLKPGGYLLAFSAARTYHRLAYSVELAGFEIRDQIMWIYGSGFPKAQDIGKASQKRQGVVEIDKVLPGLKSMQKWVDKDGTGPNLGIPETGIVPICTSPEAKQWEGWKTSLKPAHEPIVMARKPYKGSTIDNVLKNGLGALNIDDLRIPWADEKITWQGKPHNLNSGLDNWAQNLVGSERVENIGIGDITDGRYPSNVIGEVEQQKYFYNPTYDYRIKPGTDSIVIDMIKEFLCKQNTSSS